MSAARRAGHLSGLDVPQDQVDAALAINETEWRSELESQVEFFQQFGARLPKALELNRQMLLSRLD